MTKLALFLSLITSPAMAQDCIDRAPVTDHLSARFGEELHIAGLAVSGEIVEVFLSGDGTSWTVLVTSQDGCTRMVAAGPLFVLFDRQPEGEPL